MSDVWTRIEELKSNVLDREIDYNTWVRETRDAVYDVHSFNLEMYDITENTPDCNGSKKGSFSVDPSVVINIADTAFECAEFYQDEILQHLGEIQAAEPSLSDADGNPNWADTNLIELVDQFGGFLRTTCGRLFVAGEQVRAAAETYADADDTAGDTFERTEWEHGDAPAKAERWASDTDRTYDAPRGQDREEPGSADPGGPNYSTELSG